MSPIDPGLESIPHYWGDVARQLSVGAALMLVGAPWYANELLTQFPLIIIAAILSVGLAALVNPLMRWVSVFDAMMSCIIAIVYAPWAFYAYQDGEYLMFVLRMAVAIIFLFAFYFNTKTVRAMVLHQFNSRDIEVSEAEKRMVTDAEIMPGSDDLSTDNGNSSSLS